MLNIRIVEAGSKRDELVATLTVGSMHETLLIPTEHWKLDDYVCQWEGATRSAVDGRVSALITEMHDPLLANFFVLWPLYPAGEVVYVRNQLVMAERLPGPFDPSRVGEVVEPRRGQRDEDGRKISEWFVSLADVEEFHLRLLGRNRTC